MRQFNLAQIFVHAQYNLAWQLVGKIYVWRKEKERNSQQTSESKEQRRERLDRRNELDRAKRAAETDEQK